MKISATLLATAFASALAFASPAMAHDTGHTININYHDDRDIEDLSDAELVEVRGELLEALDEIKEARADIEEEMDDEETMALVRGALEIAENALDSAEDGVQEALDHVEAEQAKRAKAK